jgi:hypothetical protein
MKLFILLFLLICQFQLYAQSKVSGYRVEFSQQPYESIKPDSIIWENEFWLDSSYKTGGWGWDIPLKKNIFNQTINYTFNTFSYRVYSGTLSLYGNNYSFLSKLPDCFIREYSDTPPYQTKFAYQLDTSSGTPIFKFEITKLGVTDSTFKTKGNLSMQFWYYDGGTIELRYGPNNIPSNILSLKQPTRGKYKPTVAIAQYVDTLQSHNLMLVGPYNNPRIYNGINKPFFDLMNDSALSQFPPSGTVYRFTTWKVGILENDLQAGNFIVYPNPFITELNLTINPAHFKQMVISNAMGKHIYSGIPLNKLHTSQWLPGIYFVSLTNLDDKISYQKVIKAEN